VAMGEIDERIRTAEAQLVILKQKLGIIDDHGGNPNDTLFTETNIRQAWERRKQKLLQIEDAVVVKDNEETNVG